MFLSRLDFSIFFVFLCFYLFIFIFLYFYYSLFIHLFISSFFSSSFPLLFFSFKISILFQLFSSSLKYININPIFALPLFHPHSLLSYQPHHLHCKHSLRIISLSIMFANVAHRLSQLHQGSTPIAQHEQSFNYIAQPLLQNPQYQAELQRLYINSLNDDLKAAAMSSHATRGGHLLDLQREIQILAHKFASIDAYNALYTIKQSQFTSIAQHNEQIDSLLRLLEVPMGDDLLQDMYRKSLRPDVQMMLANREFASFYDMRMAVAMICR